MAINVTEYTKLVAKMTSMVNAINSLLQTAPSSGARRILITARDDLARMPLDQYRPQPRVLAGEIVSVEEALTLVKETTGNPNWTVTYTDSDPLDDAEIAYYVNTFGVSPTSIQFVSIAELVPADEAELRPVPVRTIELWLLPERIVHGSLHSFDGYSVDFKVDGKDRQLLTLDEFKQVITQMMQGNGPQGGAEIETKPPYDLERLRKHFGKS